MAVYLVEHCRRSLQTSSRSLTEGYIADMIQTEGLAVTPPDSSSFQPAIAAAAARSADRRLDGSSEVLIYHRSGWVAIDWKEMFAYRELLYFLVWRDMSVRYKQTILGPIWAIVQPIILMCIFTFFFGRFAKIDSEGFAYPVFVFAGLIPWTMFSQGLTGSSMSLVNHTHLLTKVYFPRLFVPVGAACVFLVDLVLSLGIYVPVLAYYRVMPSWTVIFLPLLVLLTLIATLGLGILIAAMTVFYRDLRHVLPFMVQIFMFITPVIYSMKMVALPYQYVLSLNPMFGIVAAYRSAILGLDWNLTSLAISTVSAILLFIFAVYYFRRTERRFADFA
jgi:lipopolysaccharide transport system permease protein